MRKKRFINTIVSFSLFAWLLQVVFGGVISAIISFFTKKELEKWSKKDQEKAVTNKEINNV